MRSTLLWFCLAVWVGACGSAAVQPGSADVTGAGPGGGTSSDGGATGGARADAALADGAAMGDSGAAATDATATTADGATRNRGSDGETRAPDGQAVAADATADVPPGDAPPAASCGDVLACAEAACAPSWPSGCANACVAGAPAAVAATFAGVTSCVSDCDKQCKGEANCRATCIKYNCNTAKTLCAVDGKGGEKTCGEAMTCYETKCAANNDIQCAASCGADASDAAKQQLYALFQCAQGAQGQGALIGCTSQVLACYGGGDKGTQTCLQGAQCADGCLSSGEGFEEACLGQCHSATAPSGQPALAAVIGCILKAPGGSGQCAAQLGGCITQTGSASCVQVAACADACPAQQAGSACVLGCLASGAAGQAQAFLQVDKCMDEQCKSCSDGECKQACRATKCGAAWQACGGQASP